MEFLNGRIFEDIRLLSLSANERKNWYFYHYFCIVQRSKFDIYFYYFILYYFIYSWFSLVNVLSKLHSIDYKAIGLYDYGKSSGFYSRQIRSLLKISKAQASVVDENGNEVGALPRLDEIIEWFINNGIPDESTILHGDFKV
jgi:aminoglycoside phosphotransferase (APT) family kinase protein